MRSCKATGKAKGKRHREREAGGAAADLNWRASRAREAREREEEARSERMEPASEEELQELYEWVDEIPLSRPKKNIARDFSDAGTAERTVIDH